MNRLLAPLPLLFCMPIAMAAAAGSEPLKAGIISAIDTFLAPSPHPKYACDRDSELE